MKRRIVLAGLGASVVAGCSKTAAATSRGPADSLQAKLSALAPGETLDLGRDTYIINAPLDGTHLRDVKLVGQATLRAGVGTNFEFILDISGTAGVQIDGLSFDANKAQRSSAPGKLSCLKANATTNCMLTRCTFRGALGIARNSGASSVAVSASDGCTGLRVDTCIVVDCGHSANSRPSDGIFVRGNRCTISNCHAENVTDTAFVLEGCNFSQIANCTGTNCTTIAGMSNDTADDVTGNVISGIRGTCNYFGSFGGTVGAMAFGRGKLTDCVIRDVNVRAAEHALGKGAGLYFFGPLDGVEVFNVTIDAGSTKGVVSHGIAIDGVLNLEVRDCHVSADGVGTCIRLVHDSTGVVLERNRLENGNVGIYADGTSQFVERGNIFVNCRAMVGLGGRARRL